MAAFLVMWGVFLYKSATGYMSATGIPHQMERGTAAIVNALAGFASCCSPAHRRDRPRLEHQVTIRASRVGQRRPIGRRGGRLTFQCIILPRWQDVVRDRSLVHELAWIRGAT